jgi:oligopeptide transport system permease protein
MYLLTQELNYPRKGENNLDIHTNIMPGLFEKATENEKSTIEFVRESATYWQDARRRFLANNVAAVSLLVILIIAIISIFGPMFCHYRYDQIIQGSENLLPNWQHWFGTDSLGRDLFVRCLYGARISLSIGFISAIMCVSIGVIYGSVSGYFGGVIDSVMMRIVDVVYSIPTLLIVILIQVVLQPTATSTSTGQGLIAAIGTSLFSIYFVLALLYWMDIARLVRGQILSLKNNEYVLAARTMGASNSRIIRKHLVPNTIGQIIVSATFVIPQAIFLEAFLSFIGLGVSMPMASLGSLAQSGMEGIVSYSYMVFFPAAIISIIILAFNLIGDGMRDAFDPRLKNED